MKINSRGFGLVTTLIGVALSGAIAYMAKDFYDRAVNKPEIKRLKKEIAKLERERDKSPLGKQLEKCIKQKSKEQKECVKKIEKVYEENAKSEKSLSRDLKNKVAKCEEVQRKKREIYGQALARDRRKIKKLKKKLKEKCE